MDSNSSEDISDMDFSDEFAILKEMQEDLKEHFEREYEGKHNSEIQKQKKNGNSFLTPCVRNIFAGTSLDQLKLVDCVEGIRGAQYIIGGLNENGFLSGTLSDMALVSGFAGSSDSVSLLQLLIR